MKKALLLFALIPILSLAQNLKPSIGLSSLPADNEAICNIPWYLGSFESSGLQAGDTAYDFKLYGLDGDSFVLSEKLSHGKPVLLVSGSYTCPVFRDKLNRLNSIASTYSGEIDIAIIYAVEAHPIDTSPYFGTINVNHINQSEGILFPQPRTYANRKSMTATLLQNETVNVPVYLDGPCNAWWSTYGPAPNNAYLIDTNGIVFAKHGWFDRHPDHDIACDIDSLLGLGPCAGTPTGGAFTVELMAPMVSGPAGDVLYAHATIINTTANYVNIFVKKQQPNLPAGWQTAFCFQVCFSPTEDSIIIQLAPHDTADFSTDFFTTSPLADSGSMRVGFRNTDNIANQYSLTFRAYTTELVSSTSDIDGSAAFSIYPNPSAGSLQLSLSKDLLGMDIELIDLHGQLLETQHITSTGATLRTEHLAKGLYFIRVGERVGKWMKQ